MKQIVRITLALAFIAALFAGVTSSQAALVSYDSGFQVQNLEALEASVTLSFFNRDGSSALQVTDTVPGNSSATYFPLTDIGLEEGDVPTGFDGSVVIASDRRVAAITNVLGSDGTNPLAFGASYSGFTGGSPSVSLPLLMKGNYGFDTWFSVQNVGSVATDVSVTYSDGVAVGPMTVQPGAAAKFEQSLETHAAGWVGSATVNSSATDIAIAALEVGPTTLFAYNGFLGGSTAPVMPLVQENNFGYVTGVQIQNTGAATTNVTVQYTPGPGQPGTACTETRSIAAGQSTSFALYVFTNFVDPAPSTLVSEDCSIQQFVGSAKVTANTGGGDLVAIVNQLNTGANKGAAYNAFDPASGSSSVVFPLIMDRNYGYFTGFNVVNVGTTTIAAADLTCTISGRDGGGAAVTETFNPPSPLAPGAGWNQVNLNTLANGFVGSANCVGPVDSMMVGTVNEVNVSGTGDAFLVYEGTNP